MNNSRTHAEPDEKERKSLAREIFFTLSAVISAGTSLSPLHPCLASFRIKLFMNIGVMIGKINVVKLICYTRVRSKKHTALGPACRRRHITAAGDFIDLQPSAT
jgi:hypothetical protein